MKTLGDKPLDTAAFEKECGVGVSVSDADVQAKVVALLDKFDAELKEKKYDFVTTIYGEVKKDNVLKWADGKAVSQAVDAELVKRIGERPQKGGKQPAKKEEEALAGDKAAAAAPKINEEELNAAVRP